MLGIMVLVGLIHDITKDVGGRLSNVPPAVLLSVFLRLATFVRTIHDKLYIHCAHVYSQSQDVYDTIFF